MFYIFQVCAVYLFSRRHTKTNKNGGHTSPIRYHASPRSEASWSTGGRVLCGIKGLKGPGIGLSKRKGEEYKEGQERKRKKIFWRLVRVFDVFFITVSAEENHWRFSDPCWILNPCWKFHSDKFTHWKWPHWCLRSRLWREVVEGGAIFQFQNSQNLRPKFQLRTGSELRGSGMVWGKYVYLRVNTRK